MGCFRKYFLLKAFTHTHTLLHTNPHIRYKKRMVFLMPFNRLSFNVIWTRTILNFIWYRPLELIGFCHLFLFILHHCHQFIANGFRFVLYLLTQNEHSSNSKCVGEWKWRKIYESVKYNVVRTPYVVRTFQRIYFTVH